MNGIKNVTFWCFLGKKVTNRGVSLLNHKIDSKNLITKSKPQQINLKNHEKILSR